MQGSSAFRVVRRGYDPEEVDAYFSQPAARLKEAVDQYAAGERARAELQGEVIERAQQQAEQLRAEVTAEAQRVLEQAREVAEQIRAEVEAERAAVVRETDQVRAFRDGLLDDLGRVHGEISGLLERTRKQQDQALGAGAADPKAEAAQNGNAKKPTEPTKAAEGE